MPATIFGNPAAAVGLYQAFYGKAPANATYVNNVALAAQNGPSALAAAIGGNFATTPAADLAKTVLANLGISNATLETALGQIFTAYPAGARGQIVLNLTNLLSTLETDATYGAAAKAYNITVASNNAYSSNAANTTDSTPGSTTGNEAAKSFVLTTAQDVLVGSSAGDNFRAVAGNAIGQQDQTTLNSSDIIDGGAGADTIIVNLLGNYGGGARIKGIETLQLGTNTNVSFDYNVNAGFNEISEVTKVVADQINVGETLTVNNVVRATGADGTTRSIPTISWVNDNATVAAGQAGVVNFNYRAAELIGTADTQNVELQSVLNGQLNVSGGIETISIKSLGTERVTLNNSANFDTAPNAVAADVVSAGTLTKVVLSGTAEIGKAAGILANGLTDRVVGSDLGAAVPLTTAATGSNLLSVDARVTEVDASAAEAAVNVRFLAKTTGAETNVTFKGGAGNDYVEFEVGNINATGGAGNDKFAFINTNFNSTLTTADTIDGGAGTDTIQLGVNGVGSYDLQWTEFNNKTGIDVLDLRGQTNKVELSDAFVAAADAGLTVRTDRIVQTAAGESPANPATGASSAEDASVNTIILTKLAANRAITFEGGSGSDRLVLNEQSFTANATLRGGDNVNNANPATPAVAGDYDTLTVVDNAVLSRGDLSKTSGFEGLILVKSDNASNRQFSVELTEAFLLANTQATNNATTTNIDDTVFQIGTSAAANANALGAGDTVTVDITDLFASGAYKTTLAGRGLDLTTLTAAGVTVNYIFNGAAATGAQIAAVTKVDAVGQTDVVVASAAVPGAAPLFFQGTVADETVTLVANANSVNMAGGADTLNTGAALAPTGNLNGGDGTDTLNAANGVNLTGATITSFETLNLNGAATLTAAQYGAFTTVNGIGVGDAVTLTTTGNVNGFAAVETYNLSAAGNQITLAGATAQTINGGVGADTVIASGTDIANKTISLNGGADAVTISSLVAPTANAFTLAAAGAGGANLTGVETVNFSNGLINGTGVLTMFNGAATVNLASTAGDSSGTDALQLGTGGQTVNVTGTSGYTLAGGSGADTFNLSGLTAGAASSTITLAGGPVAFGAAAATGAVSLVSAFDTITGFRAGVDKIDAATAGGANQLTTINVNVSTSLADLAGTLNNAVAQAVTLAAANWDAAGDALLVNISSGTAAGTYLVQNAAADATFDAAAELVVKLVGTVGVITQADII